MMFTAGVLSCCTGPRDPASARLAPFTADGCSCFPDGTWGHHCIEHDLSYWQGGSRGDRLEADRLLRRRLADDGKPVVGSLMFFGVRLGGTPWLPTPWRWGFGWPYPRGYRELSDEELGAVRASLATGTGGPEPVAARSAALSAN